MTDTETPKDTKTVDAKYEDSSANDDSADVRVDQVHSANAWEKADLGDAERKSKFLRLMGAGKKEHHGRFVIGEHKPDHARDSESTAKLQHQLEDQYEHSMQHRLTGGRRGHIGLGYHDADKDNEQSADSKDKDNENENDSGDAATKESSEKDSKEDEAAGDKEVKAGRKRESSDGSKEEAPEEKKSKFAKASS